MSLFKPFFLIALLCLFSCKQQEVKKIATSTSSGMLLKKQVQASSIVLTKQDVLGQLDYTKDARFQKVDMQYASKTLYIQKETLKAFILMASEAKKENIHLKIISGSRNFYAQKAIWERKWEKYSKLKPLERAKKILEFSSMPTTSRHHWGTDVDLNNLNNSYFENGQGKQEYLWLLNNANRFGFYQVYTSKANGRTGYNEEKWHWSYVPLAKHYLDYYEKNITLKDIKGFNGANLATSLDVINIYVFGISKKIPQL